MIAETDRLPPEPQFAGSTTDALPDGAAYWWDVKGYSQRIQTLCQCKNPLIGKPNTYRRWTCRICGGCVRRVRDERKIKPSDKEEKHK